MRRRALSASSAAYPQGLTTLRASNQYIFDEFLAFLKRLPNLKKLDLAYFVLVASQIPHSIESMSERKLARHVPCLVSLLQRLIDTSLL